MKPTKTKSGKWRVLVDLPDQGDGKRHRRSITADTRKQCELMAAELLANPPNEVPQILRTTCIECVRQYIDIKKEALSPSTILGYEKTYRNYVVNCTALSIPISHVDSFALQSFINGLSSHLSPKTVRNVWGLVFPALQSFRDLTGVKVSLPQSRPPKLYCPSDSDIRALLEVIHGTDLEKAVLLAAFGPLRRGEIAALTYADISGNIITVDKAVVMAPDGSYALKAPKTLSSYRKVEFTAAIIQILLRGADEATEGRVVNLSPDQITWRFEKAVRKVSCPHFRFHDLRHYAASIMHAINVPDKYIMQRGGWQTAACLNRIYKNAIDEEAIRQTARINAHFDALL